MAQECGFFNAQLVGGEYDRVYLAEQFAAYFASFIGNGVFGSSMQQLKVLAQDTANMSVKVGSGQGWINGWWYRNTDAYTLGIDVADGVLSRIDLIVLRWGQTERDMWLQVIKGKPSANPVAPSISRGADYYDLQLATVSIPAGAIKITQAQITDTRLDNSVCGLVTGVVDQIDTTSLFSQFMTAYQEWKDNQQADYEDWTDVQKAAYNQFVSDTEGDYTDFVNQSKQDYTDYTTGKQEEFNTWYTTYLTAFKTAIEAWFENIKGQISEDAAVRIQLELDDHEDVLNDIQHMVIHNDYYCPIECDSGEIIVTNDDEAILMDWSYVEAPCTRSNVGDGPTSDLSDVIIAANAAKTSLKNATTTANGVYQSLQAENAAAKSNIAVIQASLKGDEDAMMTIAIMKREIMAPYGYFGIEQNLDTLMGYVRAGQWDKFAVGDYFIDTRANGQKVMWEVADKNGYLYCGDTPLESNNIICVPRDCLEEIKRYNTTNTNTGGFAASLMPAALETIADTFSPKLQGYMATVRRLENNKGGWAWASRRISLPSVNEMLGHKGWADQYSGGPVCHSLALFTGGNAHVMKGRGFNKSVASRLGYWLADPSAANTENFCYVDANGTLNDHNAFLACGLVPLIVLT